METPTNISRLLPLPVVKFVRVTPAVLLPAPACLMGTPAMAQGTLLDVQDMVTEAAPASVLAAPAMSVLSVAFQREVWPLPTAEKVTP